MLPFGAVQQEPSAGSSLLIEETESAGNGQQPRSMLLTGSALPHMGAEWAFENAVITTWYPGNAAEATQQVLGPRELPSTWEGEWRRTLLGRHPVTYRDGSGAETRIMSPMLLRAVLEEIARAGVRLRVTWAVRGTEGVGSQIIATMNLNGTVRATRSPNTRTVDAQIVREGRIKTFRTPIDRHTDVKWSIEFAWLGRGAKQDKASAAREDEAADVAAAALEASVNATVALTQVSSFDAFRSIRRSATRFTLGHLENMVGAPQKLVTNLTRKLQSNVSDFKRVGAVAKKFSTQPAAIQNAVIDFARSTMSAANVFVDTMGRRPAETNAAKMKVSALLRASVTFGRIVGAASHNARQAAALEASQRALVVSGANRGALTVRESSSTRAGAIVAIHVCKVGETPQSVSMRYYGTADQGGAILRSNRMPLYQPTFPRGQILVIPSLAAVARS